MIWKNQQKSYTPSEYYRKPNLMILYLQMTDCMTWTYNQGYKKKSPNCEKIVNLCFHDRNTTVIEATVATIEGTLRMVHNT